MGSETPLTLPVVDFSNLDLRDNDIVWSSVKTQVRHALLEYGCFQATLIGMTSELRKSMFASLDELFDLPLETKLTSVSDKPFHGYIGHSPTMPLYESMGIPNAPLRGNVENFTNFFWPQGNVSFCKNIETISEKLHGLDQMLRRMLLESLGLEKYLEEHTQETSYLLRVAKYKGPETNESQTGLTSHVDKTTLSILYQNGVDGLEIQTKGGDWISVKQSPDSFTVFAGEVLYAWTNGRVYAPYHRVVMSGNEHRYSLGLFSVPKAGYITKVPEEMVDEEHPLLFKPFDYDAFLRYFFANPKENALETYCGANESALKAYSSEIDILS